MKREPKDPSDPDLPTDRGTLAGPVLKPKRGGLKDSGVAAGRSSHLDGGIYLYGLDPATGETRGEHHLVGPFTNAGMTRENPSRGLVMSGALPDVLVADGKVLCVSGGQ